MARRTPVFIGLLAALLLVFVQALPAGAANPVRFGAKLTHTTQPQNVGIDPVSCHDEVASIPSGKVCTWVMNHSEGGDPGYEKAPKDGWIHKARVISCVAGSFRLQFARIKAGTQQARVIRDGTSISYPGDSDDCDDDFYDVNVINVHLWVKKGDRIVVRAKQTAAMSNHDGGPHTLLYYPKLPVGGNYTPSDGSTGGNLLVQLQY